MRLRSNVQKFEQQQVEDSIFRNEQPTVTLFPFPNGGRLGHVSVDLNIRTSFVDKPPRELLADAILRVGDFTVDTTWVGKLTRPVFVHVWNSYIDVTNMWTVTCRGAVKVICNTTLSRNYWLLYKNSVPDPKTMTLEYGLWVLYNMAKDKEEDVKTLIAFRDSLLPWLQPEIWNKMQEKEPARKNIMYEEHRKQMMSGTFGNNSELDIIE